MAWNPFFPSEDLFYRFKAMQPQKVTVEDSLYGSFELPDGYRVSNTGNYIAPANTVESEQFDASFLDELAKTHAEQVTSKNLDKISLKGSENLSKIIDEVSNEEGFEKLKDPYIKKLILLQAKRESSFNPTAQNKHSSASGYFQFIDGTRKKYSNYSKADFLKDQKEQVRTAYKYFSDIHNSPSALKLKQQGYNDAIITALGWWYPKSMNMVLEGKKDFSLGGYSIKKAIEDYG